MTPKFRPVLDSDQIAHICNLCRKDSSKESMHVLASLASFEWKVKSGAVTPAYTPAPKESLASSLGFEKDIPHGNPHHIHTDEALYSMWADDPSTLSVDQLKRVRFYRYENNKMTVEEEAQYEREIMGLDV
jgi:hypothetical protein